MRRKRSSRDSSLRILRADEAEHDRCRLRHVTQRAEIARPFRVELEEQQVGAGPPEHLLGDGLVSATGHPVALVVAAAQVKAGGDRRRYAIERTCDRADVVVDELVRILACGGDDVSGVGITQHRERDLVELDDVGTAAGEVGDLLLIHAREISEERRRRRVHAESGPNQNCMVDGDGNVTFTARSLIDRTKSTSWPETGSARRTGPMTWGAVNASRSPESSVNAKRASPTSSPSTTSTKRFQYDSRRNSPSVTTERPISSCIATTSRMASSCAVRSASSLTVPSL